MEPPSDSPTRRWFVAGLLGALPAAKLITACAGGDDDDSSGTGQLSDDDDATDDDASFDDDDTTIDCTLYPQQTAGAFLSRSRSGPPRRHGG
ncbi:MAG: hypothetical protein M5R36_04680 [Deltaproteobacteria bacterium]|nr:hypothetical protein [Deltaproteobacteria bacterium]